MGLQNYATVRLGTFPERMVFFFSSSCHRHYSRTLYALLSEIFIAIVANKKFLFFSKMTQKSVLLDAYQVRGFVRETSLLPPSLEP